MDANGRLKLGVSLLQDFQRRAEESLVLFCLPEGALGLYTTTVWNSMRRHESDPAAMAGRSMLARRSMRRFGAFSQRVELTRQGRITIPSVFRDHADVPPGSEVIVLGVEIGVEIWSEARWSDEQRLIQEHMLEKGQRELAEDLSSGLCQGDEKVGC
jgi:DNA-binding transcriptional regulator/RsmH inhibitor MraZ